MGDFSSDEEPWTEEERKVLCHTISEQIRPFTEVYGARMRCDALLLCHCGIINHLMKLIKVEERGVEKLSDPNGKTQKLWKEEIPRDFYKEYVDEYMEEVIGPDSDDNNRQPLPFTDEEFDELFEENKEDLEKNGSSSESSKEMAVSRISEERSKDSDKENSFHGSQHIKEERSATKSKGSTKKSESSMASRRLRRQQFGTPKRINIGVEWPSKVVNNTTERLLETWDYQKLENDDVRSEYLGDDETETDGERNGGRKERKEKA